MSGYSPPSDSDIEDMDYWGSSFSNSQPSYIPISYSRSEEYTIEQFVKASSDRRARLALHVIPQRQTVTPPEIFQISDGILRENGHLLYTVKHPSVVKLMEYVCTHWQLPPNQPDTILALAALESFLTPFSVVHWLFWSQDKMDQSAKLVHRVLGRRTPTIYSPVSWSALDWKFRLSGIHSKQLPQVLSSMPWYDTLVLPNYLKDSPTGPVLRKRKARTAADLAQNPSEHGNDEEESPNKRPRFTRARTSQLRNSTIMNPIPSPTNIPSPDIISVTSALSEVPTTSRAPSRKSPNTRPSVPSSRPPPRAASTSSSTSLSSLSPNSLPDALPPVTEYTRTRSSSRLSARTLVDDGNLSVRDCSPSISSSTATVDSFASFSAKAKGKQKAVDSISVVLEIAVEDDNASSIGDVDSIPLAAASLPRTRKSHSTASASAKTEGVPSAGPHRIQFGRESRAISAHPYSAARIVAKGERIQLDGADAVVLPPPAQKRNPRKAKKSRR